MKMHTASFLLKSPSYLNSNVKLMSRVSRNVTKIASHSRRPVEKARIGFRSTAFGYNHCFRPSNVAVRLFSTSGRDSPEEDSDKDESPMFTSSQLPATVAVPEVWPQVPVIAINRNPVFPRFIKLIEVCIHQYHLILVSLCY